jgi:hypothetical protein
MRKLMSGKGKEGEGKGGEEGKEGEEGKKGLEGRAISSLTHPFIYSTVTY